MSYLQYVLSAEEEEVIRTLEPIFMYKGNPTEDYKCFLIDVVSYVTTATYAERCNMQTFIMRCEEGAYIPITGIISIKKSELRYREYATILNAIYGEGALMYDKVDICNTIVDAIIKALNGGCKYSSCHRNNALHKQLMHRPLQIVKQI